ncbi:molybdopterin-guanine dinucleotide biosynthesis protein B [Sulfobacillus thermosulfidooxidans]|uniref:molybdopterin-guanine dinucleotide biosynthesis protein B n=1 Tax=Sulfobacillus thermosulfidooxidans TaxID=28034 RepID=UPI0006B5048B|nr:molybdopterin-guanine dinucleotide biosynthesis protein MobB [Sulfobacillus thermosulfidooxidans]
MRVFHIVGYSNVGKTRLIEAMCQRLNGRILVLKFSHHPSMDRPGSDTDRLAAHHADTLLIQPGQTTWRSSLALPIDWSQVAQHFEWMIWEGGKHFPTPKIVFNSADILEHVSNIRLIIGPPSRKLSTVCAYPTCLPLNEETRDNLAEYIIQQHKMLSFEWNDPSAQLVYHRKFSR